MAVVLAIVTAAVSFSLLTSAVATSRVEVTGTVEANYRSAYDILVRPPGSRGELEESRSLVRNNFLSGIDGGISMREYRRIAEIPGVEVAAPIAMVGYFLPSQFLQVGLNDLVTDDPEQVFRISATWVTDRGLSKIPVPDRYLYASSRDNGRDECRAFDQRSPIQESAFGRSERVDLSCFGLGAVKRATTRYGSLGEGVRPFIDDGEPADGAFVTSDYQVPLLLAAVDPVQEARLVGLDQAMTNGRYLTGLRPRIEPARPDLERSLRYRQLPVIMPEEVESDEQLVVDVERLDAGDPSEVSDLVSSPRGRQWLEGLSGQVVRSTTLTTDQIYPKIRARYESRIFQRDSPYWTVGPVDYVEGDDGHLIPRERHVDKGEWYSPLFGTYFGPWVSSDVGFRQITGHAASNEFTSLGGVYSSPLLRSVGRFDPNLLPGFAELSQVPLTTYAPPAAAPGDERTARLLGGQDLLPNANLGGYLQQPPLMLTNLQSLRWLNDTNAYSDLTTTLTDPLSVIRIRVAGVTGPDEASQERVRLVAERILRDTDLDVDITVGSSPEPQLIDLPAGEYGRPALTLEEGWSRKGVAVSLLDAIDRKSLALFGLVLVVCVSFLLNATVASVRGRRRELGVLSTLGWPARRIFALLEVELLLTGLLAGLLGTGLAAALSAGFDLSTRWWHLALITPVAVLLAGLSGAWPAWRASRVVPIEAMRPAVRAPRRASRIDSVSGMGLSALRRWPGRTALGALSLAFGVAALQVLLSIQTGFQGDAVGTLLGDVVAVQVRGVDYLAAALTIALGAFTVADVTYLNITERTSEIGVLRSSGWGESQVRQLFATESVATAALGAFVGVAVGATVTTLVVPIGLTTGLQAAALAFGIGLLAALVAITVPLLRSNGLAPAAAIRAD